MGQICSGPYGKSNEEETDMVPVLVGSVILLVMIFLFLNCIFETKGIR